jgi:hypothetical protein
MPVAGEEAVVEQLRRVKDCLDLVVVGEFSRLGHRGENNGIRSIMEALLRGQYAFYIVLHSTDVLRAGAQPDAYCVGYLLQRPLLALIRVYTHEGLLGAEHAQLRLD